MGNIYSHLRLLAHVDDKDDSQSLHENLETKFSTPVRNLPSHLLSDPRSATIGIIRSPIFALTEEIPDMDESVDEIEIIPEPASPIVEEKNPTVEEQNLDLIAVQIEEKLNLKKLEVFKDEALDEPSTETSTEPDLISFTPQRKALKKKTIRTPLGNICTNSHSPISSLENVKPWKRIKEERVRLGLDDPENTPPSHSPLFDITRSAPGKFASRSMVPLQDSPLII